MYTESHIMTIYKVEIENKGEKDGNTLKGFLNWTKVKKDSKIKLTLKNKIKESKTLLQNIGN